MLGLLWWYGWLVGPQLARPYVYDDVNFALGGRAVARTGLPYGNQGYLLHLFEQREQWAIWHPPLYVYALGLWMRVFGDGEPATRSLGVLCQLLAAGVAFDIARRVAEQGGGSRTRGLAAGLIAFAILLVNPLAIQAAQILDIDNTVLTLLLAAAVWLAIRLPGRWGWRTIIAFGLLFALTLWAKLTTPWILLAGLVFTRFFQGLGVRGALEALAVGVVGCLVFLATWVGVAGATGMPIDYTLTVLSREAEESTLSSRARLVSVPAFLHGIAPAILWLGPFFCLLFVLAGVPRLWSLVRGRGLVAGDLLVVLGAAIYLVYFVKLAGALPKYHSAMLPLWAAACGILVARAAGRSSPAQLALSVGGLVALTTWLVAPMADEWTITWTPGVLQLLVGVPLLAGIGLAALWSLLGVGNRLGGVAVALLVLTLSWSIALDLGQRDRIGSTTYFYGRYGQQAAAEVVDRLLRPGEVYVAAKDVAWYSAHDHYVDQDTWQHVVWEQHGGVFDGTYLGRDIRVLALEFAEPSLRIAYSTALSRAGYESVGEYGNFRVYVRGE
ncbi:MAG: glycosyltransferase family 39 protein [Chloroflexota bacterium]|nr:glycosyltransferase family 39 protein [Chloroflexota bacterium]